MAKGYRKVTIINNGKEEIWQWMYGKSTISIRSPDNKGYHIDIEDNFSRSITPKHIVNYICNKILKIDPPVSKENINVINNTNPVVIPKKKIFIVHRNLLFDFERKNSIYKIFHEPSDAKRCQKEMNEQAKKELSIMKNEIYGIKIDSDDLNDDNGYSLNYTSDIHEVY